MNRFQVIYLTGPPATGKSTACTKLKSLISPVMVFEYGHELTRLAARRHGAELRQSDVRKQSANIITPEDVAEADAQLLKLIADHRTASHILIDSHAVTKEEYGFRVTAFSLDRLRTLAPTIIFCLYATPAETIARIRRDPAGRPQITEFESATHTNTQIGVATAYGIFAGCPVYIINTETTDAATFIAQRVMP